MSGCTNAASARFSIGSASVTCQCGDACPRRISKPKKRLKKPPDSSRNWMRLGGNVTADFTIYGSQHLEHVIAGMSRGEPFMSLVRGMLSAVNSKI